MYHEKATNFDWLTADGNHLRLGRNFKAASSAFGRGEQSRAERPRKMAKPLEFLLFFSFLAILSHNPIAAEDPMFVDCPQSENYTSGSQFEDNLKSLFLSLSPSSTVNITGYYNAAYGNGSDLIYGYSQCMSDATQDACHACLQNSTVEIVQRCPNRKKATIRYYNCILRYSYEPFFSQLDDGVLLTAWPTANISDPTQFESHLGNLMRNLTVNASPDFSKYAQGAIEYGDSQTIFGLAQCTRDLSSDDCTKCLQGMISEIPNCCDGRQGGNVYSVSCNIAYEVYPFFDGAPPHPPSITYSIASVLPTPTPSITYLNARPHPPTPSVTFASNITASVPPTPTASVAYLNASVPPAPTPIATKYDNASVTVYAPVPNSNAPSTAPSDAASRPPTATIYDAPATAYAPVPPPFITNSTALPPSDAASQPPNSGNREGSKDDAKAPSNGKTATRNRKIAIGVGAGIGGLLLTCFFFFAFGSLFSCSNSCMQKTKDSPNVELFLMNYGSLILKRYSYSDIKKITSSFKEKLGRGGFGSVFKGKLSDGCLVAVKILEESKGNGEEFINEVASIGRTYHVNIVPLLGFCSEGLRRALIYEFMPNGSLEKFIYADKPKVGHPLGWEKLYDIALGIAQGLEYLHRGCTTRILHFDIKPHNILLDQEFCPKISDFGLAKLCPTKESILSMSAARGTVGYIAPEVYCRNFGGVSYKSDVYSYGMMMLEMVGGRKNFDALVENTSEIFFPQWVYRRLELHQDLGLHGVVSQAEEEIARKMIIVGLWCIQTNPTDRPSMGRAIEMLKGSLESLPMPPNPILSFPSTPSEGCSVALT